MKEKQLHKLKRNHLKRKIKFMITTDRTEIRRHLPQQQERS